MKKWTSLLLAAVLLTVLCVASFATFVSAKTVEDKFIDGADITTLGGKYATGVKLLMATDAETTLGELFAAQGTSTVTKEKHKDMNAMYVVIFAKEGGIVTDIQFEQGRSDPSKASDEEYQNGLSTYSDSSDKYDPNWAGIKTNVTVPADSWVLVYHADTVTDAFKKIKEGDKVDLTLQDGKTFDTVKALTDAEATEGTTFSVTTTKTVENVVTTGAVLKNWGVNPPADVNTQDNYANVLAGVVEAGSTHLDKVLYLNTECKTEGMKVELVRDVEGGELNTVTLTLYTNPAIMCGYPEGKAIVEISADGSSYTKVGEFDLTAVDMGTKDNLAAAQNVETVMTLSAKQTAAKVKVTLTVGSSTATLGDSPADGKVNWEFMGLAGFQTSVETTADETTSTPDETTSTADETTSTADETTSTADVTTSEESSTAATSSEESSAAATSSEEASSGPVMVQETITIDGKLDDLGWISKNAQWVTLDQWNQPADPTKLVDTKGETVKYTVRSDADNVYIALEIGHNWIDVDAALDLNKTEEKDGVVTRPDFETAVSNYTRLRIWIGGEKTTGTDAEGKPIDVYPVAGYFDIVRQNGEVKTFFKKVATTNISAAIDGNKLEIKLPKTGDVTIGDTVKLNINFSDKVYGAEGTTYLQINGFAEDQNRNWKTSEPYPEFDLTALALTMVELPVNDESSNTSAEASAGTSAAASSGTSAPTGDTGVILFAVVGLIALAGAVVAIRVRR